MNWFRLYAEARNDRKLRTLTDSEHRIWFNLLCFASEQQERGTIPVQDISLLSLEVADGDEDLLNATIQKLIQLRIVSLSDVTPCHALSHGCSVTFIHFAERQYDKPSDHPGATRSRQQQSRHNRLSPAYKEDSSISLSDVTPMSRPVTPVTPIQEEKRVEIQEERSNPPIVPPLAADAAQTRTAARKSNQKSKVQLERRLEPRPDFLERMQAKYAAYWSPEVIADYVADAQNYYQPRMVNKGEYADIELCIDGSLRRKTENQGAPRNGRNGTYQGQRPTGFSATAPRGPEEQRREDARIVALRRKGFA